MNIKTDSITPIQSLEIPIFMLNQNKSSELDPLFFLFLR